MKADPSYDIPNKSSTGTDWQNWYSELYSALGVKVANQLFLSAWKNRSSSSANTADLRAYLKKYGVSLETGLFGSIEDVSLSALDTIGSIFSMGKYATIGAMGLGAVVVIIIAIGIAKHPKEIVQAAKVAAI
jgi:hypothetical protein